MGKRKPQKCSFCGKSVQNLSRHKREVHNMDTLECKLGDYINGAKKAPKRLVKFCPLSPCKRKQKPIFQLHRHLQSEIHKLKPSTRPYDDALRSATRVHLNDVEERLEKRIKRKVEVGASGDEKKEEISSSSEDSSERRKRDEKNDKQEVNDNLELKPSSHQENEEKKKKDGNDVNKEKVEGMEKPVYTSSDKEYDALAEEVWEQTKHVGLPEETSCKDNIVEIVSSSDSDISEFLPTDSDERTDNTDTSHNSTAESSLTDTSALADERDELLTELVEMNGEENCRGSSFLDGDIPWKRCVNTFIKAKHQKGYIFKSSSECEANLLAEVTKMQDYEMKDILEDDSDNDDVLDEEWVPSEVECTRKEEHENDEVLQQFYEWLVEVDGGYRDEKSAKQYQSQVKSVIHKLKEYSDSDEKKQLSCSELMTLEGQEGVTLLKKWLTYAVKQYQPGTVRCYLMSIRLFYKFLSQEGKTTSQEIVNSRRDLMTSWSAAQKKKSLKRRLEKKDEDYKKILSGETLHQVCHGNQRVQTIKQLGKTCATRDDGQNSFMVNDKSYCEVRDYLITRLTIDNSGRSGIASNMTLEEFKEAVFYEGNEEDEARYRVLVKEHKTSIVYGAAVVWVYSDLYKMIEMYIKTLRQQVTQANPTVNNVFVSSNGMSLTSSQISTSIWRTFQRENIELNGRISATTIRKSLATGVHIHMPQDKEKLAALAQHKPQTQRNYYCVHDKVTDTDLGRRAVSKFVSMKAKDVKDTAVKVTHVEWTIDEEDCLKNIFSDEINAGGITNEVVRDKLGASNILVHHTLKAVVLKLKHMREKHMETVCLPQDEEDSHDKVLRYLASTPSESAPTEQSEARTWSKFSNEQTEYLVSLNKDMVESNTIKRELVWQRVKNDKTALQLGLIVQGETDEESEMKQKQRLTDKLRHEARRLRAKKKKS